MQLICFDENISINKLTKIHKFKAQQGFFANKMKRRSISTWSRANQSDKSHYSPTPKLFPGSFLVYAFCKQKWSERLRFSTTFLKLEGWFFAKNFEAFTSNKHLFLNQSQYDKQITLLAHSKTIFRQFMPFVGEVLRFSTKFWS